MATKKAVFNAPKSITITVLASDIKNGKQFDPKKCALALAMARFKKENKWPKTEMVIGYVLPSSVVSKNKVFYTISEKANEFIRKFDDDKKKVKPTSFKFKLVKQLE